MRRHRTNASERRKWKKQHTQLFRIDGCPLVKWLFSILLRSPVSSVGSITWFPIGKEPGGILRKKLFWRYPQRCRGDSVGGAKEKHVDAVAFTVTKELYQVLSKEGKRHYWSFVKLIEFCNVALLPNRCKYVWLLLCVSVPNSRSLYGWCSTGVVTPRFVSSFERDHQRARHAMRCVVPQRL